MEGLVNGTVNSCWEALGAVTQSIANPDESMTTAVVDSILAASTFLVLLLLRLVLGWALLWRRHKHDTLQTSGVEQTQRQRQIGVMARLPGDVLVYLSGFLIALIAIHTSPQLLTHPLSSAGHSKLIHAMTSASVGHFIYRLTFIYVNVSRGHDWDGLDVIGYIIGVIAAATVLVTRQLCLLAAVGLIYQFPFVACTLDELLDSHQRRHVTVSAVCVTASVVCMLATSIGGIVLCFTAEKLSVLSLWSGAVCAMACAYMVLYGLWFIGRKVFAMRQLCVSRLASRPSCDRTPLLNALEQQSFYSDSHNIKPLN